LLVQPWVIVMITVLSENDAGDAIRTWPRVEPLEGPLTAVKGLQEIGLKVIVVVNPEVEDPLLDLLCGDLDVDHNALLCHRSFCKDGCDVVRVAEQYRCAFAMPEPPQERKWTLPKRLRVWAQAASTLELRYSFSSDGSFCPCLSAAVHRHLESISATAPLNLNGLSAQIRFCSAQDLLPSSNPLQRDTTLPWSDGAACLLTVSRGLRSEILLCVRCGDASTRLFQAAAGLACEAMETRGGDSFQESEDDEGINVALLAMGGDWVKHGVVLLTTTTGPRAGLRAVGTGSNKQKRRRAAMLALAVTAAVNGATLGEQSEEVASLVTCLKGALEG